MPDNNQRTTHLKRLEHLLAKRKQVLAMTGEKALDAILDMQDALPLVHSFSEEDLYFLINDIGVEDALPILGMASKKQWEYMMDMAFWHRDQIDFIPVLKWFDLLQRADTQRFTQWLMDENRKLLEYCLYKNIDVKIREHDQDPSEFGNGYFTLDDVYYIKFIAYPFSQPLDETAKEERDIVLSRLLRDIAETDYLRYQQILFETGSIIPVEIEEELFRLRNVRLAEKGFLPFDEAVGIYQPPAPYEEKMLRVKKMPSEDDTEQFSPIALYPSMVVDRDSLLSVVLDVETTEFPILVFQSEFAALCNQIIAADQKTIQERDQLKEVVKKACGYICIGLEQMSGNVEKPAPDHLSALIRKYSLGLLFRTGYGLALGLKFRAERFQQDCFYLKQNMALTFWGETGLGVLGGLLLKRPLYFDNYETGVFYREFSSLRDIAKTEKNLQDIIMLDELVSCLPVDPVPMEGRFMTYKSFLLTLWARDFLGLPEEMTVIPMEQFIVFFDRLFDHTAKPYNVKEKMKSSFYKWISEKSRKPESEVTQALGHIFDGLFNELEEEYGGILTKDLDPRYIHLFLLECSLDTYEGAYDEY